MTALFLFGQRWFRALRSWLVPAAIAAAVAAFLWAGNSDLTRWGPPDAATCSYNLLLQGFGAGQLSLKKEAPPELAKLTDPYDPKQNDPIQARYGLHDLSFFRGKLYLYFGVSPVFLLFWPWRLLTEDYLQEQAAVALFCVVGLLASARLYTAVRRRYFPGAGPGVTAAGLVALGFGGGLPILLQRAGMWEVPVACAYALVMLTLGAFWRAIHRPARRLGYAAAASLGCGLIVGARPALLFGAALLLAPVARFIFPSPDGERPARASALRLAAAAAVPFGCILAGLMAYNAWRFGSPFEFGQRYQLNDDPPHIAGAFSLRYLEYNLRAYVFGPARWTRGFPFIADPARFAFPRGYLGVENSFAVLRNIPVIWMVLALPLAGLTPAARRRNRPLFLFLFAVAGVCLGGFAPLCLFQAAADRYEIDFLPEGVFLAAIGILAAEQALVKRPAAQRVTRAVWGGLLAASLAFNVCASIDKFAAKRVEMGRFCLAARQYPVAAWQFELALRAKPGLADVRNSLGICYACERDLPRALAEFEAAEKSVPASGPVHRNHGFALSESGRFREAADEFRAALKLDPADTASSLELRDALEHLGPAAAGGFGGGGNPIR